jgi:sulfate-transporting ATPase
VTSVWGGLHAGILASSGIVFVAMDRWVDLGDWFQVISGALLIVTLITHPEGIASGGHQIAERFHRWRAGRRPATATAEASADEPGAEPGADISTLAADGAAVAAAVGANGTGAALEIEHLKVRYGGVVAVNDVSLQVEPGSIVGLIGPNGAGKTSVIDAVTGFAPATGSITLAGRRIDSLATHARVRAGLARTFQSLELYDDLSVEENVSVAAFGARRSDRTTAVTRALQSVGIAALRDRPAGQLSQGERQLVSIARACVAAPAVLLLDEPAAGLDTTESEWLGERIRAIRATGTGVLLVDHDVALVLSVCDHVHVLDFGAVIASGTPDEIRANRAVADAYLGALHDATTAPAEPEAPTGTTATTGTEVSA